MAAFHGLPKYLQNLIVLVAWFVIVVILVPAAGVSIIYFFGYGVCSSGTTAVGSFLCSNAGRRLLVLAVAVIFWFGGLRQGAEFVRAFLFRSPGCAPARAVDVDALQGSGGGGATKLSFAQCLATGVVSQLSSPGHTIKVGGTRFLFLSRRPFQRKIIQEGDAVKLVGQRIFIINDPLVVAFSQLNSNKAHCAALFEHALAACISFVAAWYFAIHGFSWWLTLAFLAAGFGELTMIFLAVIARARLR